MRGHQSIQNLHGRQSLRTHLQRPVVTKQDNSLLSYILVAVCLIVIVYSLVESKQNFPNDSTQLIEQRERGELEQRISKGVIGKYSRQQVQTLEKQNMLIIPTIAGQSTKCKTRKKFQIQKQTIANIQVFKMLHKFNKQMTKQQIFKKYFTKIIPLKAVKHHKFSSPRDEHQKISTFINDWFNPFYNREQQQYRGIDRIFIANNQQVWSAYSSHGGYLTVVSDQLIKLAFIRIKTPVREEDIQDNPEQQEDFLYIFGISALDTTLTNKNTLQTTLIIKLPIGHGINQIQCNKQQCNMEYSMVMLMMADRKKIQILSLQLYQHKS